MILGNGPKLVHKSKKNIQYIELNYHDLQQFYEIFMEKLRYLEYIKLLV